MEFAANGLFGRTVEHDAPDSQQRTGWNSAPDPPRRATPCPGAPRPVSSAP